MLFPQRIAISRLLLACLLLAPLPFVLLLQACLLVEPFKIGLLLQACLLIEPLAFGFLCSRSASSSRSSRSRSASSATISWNETNASDASCELMLLTHSLYCSRRCCLDHKYTLRVT